MITEQIQKKMASLVGALSNAEQGVIHQSESTSDPYIKLNRRDFEDDDVKVDLPFTITCFTYNRNIGELESFWEVRFNDTGEAVFFGDMNGNSFDEDKMNELLAPFIN